MPLSIERSGCSEVESSHTLSETETRQKKLNDNDIMLFDCVFDDWMDDLILRTMVLLCDYADLYYQGQRGILKSSSTTAPTLSNFL